LSGELVVAARGSARGLLPRRLHEALLAEPRQQGIQGALAREEHLVAAEARRELESVGRARAQAREHAVLQHALAQLCEHTLGDPGHEGTVAVPCTTRYRRMRGTLLWCSRTGSVLSDDGGSSPMGSLGRAVA